MSDQSLDHRERFIEVIGGYDEDFGAPPTRRPLPADAVLILRELKDCEQIRRYLIALPSTLMLQNYRHIQYRNLEDGSLYDFYGYGAFDVRWGGPEPIEATQVFAFPTATEPSQDSAAGAGVACCAPLSAALRAARYPLVEIGASGRLTVTVGWNPNEDGSASGFAWVERTASFCPFCGRPVGGTVAEADPAVG